MKRDMWIFLIAMFLCLNADSVFAANADLSGHVIIITSVENGSWSRSEVNTKWDGTTNTDGSGGGAYTQSQSFAFDITQASDGSISATSSSYTDAQNNRTDNLTGLVRGGSVNFHISTVINENKVDRVYDGWDYYHITTTLNDSYSADFSGFVINGQLTGTIRYGENSFSTFTTDSWAWGAYQYKHIEKQYACNYTGTSSGSLPKPQPVLTPNRPQDYQFGKPDDPAKTVGDPINSVTGNMHIITPDLTIPEIRGRVTSGHTTLITKIILK